MPRAGGVRLAWEDVPGRVRAAVEGWLGSPIVAAVSQAGGFSPGAAVRARTADGRRVFIKSVGPELNPISPSLYRREALVAAVLPPEAPAPRLLWWADEGEEGWVTLVFEEIDGSPPAVPWDAGELERVMTTLGELSAALTPSPVPEGAIGRASSWGVVTAGWWIRVREERPAGLDVWSGHHLERLVELEAGIAEAVGGETLLHLDLRADNLLLTPDRVLVVDWPYARIGAAWLDPVCFAPSVAMQGGPEPEELLTRHPAARAADPAAITVAVATVAGFFTHQALQPAPPGLPTLRAFQAAQGAVARRWLAQRTGWEGAE